jgi:SAM-dependent methyltransferase
MNGETERMLTLPDSASEFQKLYRIRFAGRSEYRTRVWNELSAFFGQWISADATLLDLGCGHCEFINAVKCARKFGMDLNPDAKEHAVSGVDVLIQDCSEPWGLARESLDVVFTSNFFEHLPTKDALQRTVVEAYRAMKCGGRLIAIGPNIRYVRDAYWDFSDHYLPLTELSLAEVLKSSGFEVEVCCSRFLPYTMSAGSRYPIWLLKVYIAFPLMWRFFGKQFLLVARRPKY